MLERLPVRRHVRRLALLALAALVLANVPGLPANAQATTTQPLDDTQVDFAQGTLLRTAVNAGVVPGNPRPFEDQDGTLELAAAGNLNQWQVAVPGLPAPLAYMGATTIGSRIYSVGGATSGGADNFTDAAYWTAVDQQTGSFKAHGFTEGTKPPGSLIPPGSAEWINDPLPQTFAYMGFAPFNEPNPDSECNDEPLRGRRGPAVASFVTGTGTDYIYVIGGAFKRSVCGLDIVASSAVQTGAVNAATGDITWSADPNQANYLPSQNFAIFETWNDISYVGLGNEALGVEGATASVVTTGSGRTFLYVIGGLATWDDGSSPQLQDLATPAVFYTELNPATGAMQHPTGGALTPWARGPNVPLDTVQSVPPAVPNPGELGIYNHTAMVSRALVGEGTGTTVRSAIFVTGGFTRPPSIEPNPTAQATVFRATVNDDGTLVWETALNPNPAVPERVSIEGARAGLGGFAFGNKLYVLGGRPTATDPPRNTATIGVHNDQLDMLPLFGSEGSSTYFTGGQGQVIDAVDGLGAVAIAATPPPGATEVTNTGWGFALGGANASNAPTDIVRRGPIGGRAEAEQSVRIPDGWYYSRFFNIRFESATENLEARILSVRWFTGLNREANPNTDLRLEFQRTKLLPCNEAAFAGVPWVPLDGSSDGFSSVNGFNEVKLRDIFPTEDFNASCFRYRVYMTQNGSTDGVPNVPLTPNLSPQLFSINVEKVRPGDPDLQVTDFQIGPDADGRIGTFDLKITNLNGTVINTSVVAGGQFPVVLCVAYSTEGPPELTVPELPVLNDPDSRVNCAPVYRWIDPTETTPGVIFPLNNNWRVNFDNVPWIPGQTQDSLLADPKEAFAVPGYYAVAVLIDPFNVVPEGGQIKANNRGENLNDGQPLVRRFQITQGGFDRTLRLPFVAR